MLLKRLLLLLYLFIWLPGCSEPQPESILRVLTWPGYADPDLVKAFEERYHVHVEVTFIDTDDDLWAKANQNESQDFDVLAVNTAELQRYVDSGLSVPIDLNNIPNTQTQLPRFKDLASIPGIMRGGKIYAIPYTYSTMGLIYNRQMVKSPPDSMAAMWDQNYQGKVLAFDASNHNFSITALILGIADPFQLDDEQFTQVQRKLVELRRNVLTFYSAPEEAVDLFQNNQIAYIFGNYGSQQVKQLRDAGADIGYVNVKEGTLAWLDCWSVTKGAKDHKLAETWINYTLEQSVSDALSARQGLPNTVEPSNLIKSSDKIIWLQPVEDFEKRGQLWQKIRSGDSLQKF
ncbi:spermidine/putrescine ABC transporter substrate-binding protein [Hahella sp. CCB-MM4]|uniref:ABC transporter substrate-binding protein n=1 Tax=Hahella sp. (strain CCB-MM4) TaxID=1926491 RepID=UPI000B9BC2DB|nr:ABC transporter substrate-binding protein [Hahella sp. CCB-MM4]OZG75261.1 spermidine/putrescine ABC transporter substrate-binding protein [Hahella sp. CCB-MM4]